MEFLRSQLQRIREQLAALSASQRMLAVTLVVIIVGTLLAWSKYAGSAEMEPVLDQPIPAEDITRITMQLKARAIDYKVAGDRILVPADKRSEALADLAYSQLLPRDTKQGIDELIKNSSPWMAASDKKEMWNKHKEMTLASIIRGFPGVSNAMVMIDTTQRPELAPGGGVQPSATINLTMRSGQKADSRLVNAAADLVAGAVANLPKGRVKVVADGVSCAVASDDHGGGGAWLDETRDAEKYFVNIIHNQLSYIDGAMIAVRVVPNRIKKESVNHKIGKDKFSQPTRETSTIEEGKQLSKTGAAESGVVPNGPMALGTDTSGGDSSSQNRERVESQFMVDYDRLDERQWDPGGTGIITGASVFLPRSHFVRVFKQHNPSAQDPDDAALQPLIDTQLARIKKGVQVYLGLEDAAIEVAPYTDLMPVASEAPAVAASSFSLSLGGHTKEIAVGGLALVSLVIMTLMVRKGAPAPPVAAQIIAKPAPKFASEEEPVGEATEGAQALDGMELDEDAIRTQQMLDQVSSLVKDNPDAAANLVKRWLNRP